MPLTDHDRTKLKEFLEEVSPLLPAYAAPTFRFMAVKCDGEWVIFQGLACLSWATPKLFVSFETSDVRVLELQISQDASSLPKFLDDLLDGRIELHGTSYALPVNHSGHHSSHHAPFDGVRNGASSAAKFSLTGSNGYYHFSQHQRVLRPLRANPISFDSIEGLARHYGLSWDSMNIRVEVEASSIARFVPECILSEGTASFKVLLAKGLDPDLLCINRPARAIGGPFPHPPVPPILWQSRTSGGVEFEVGDIRALTCLLTYDGLVQEELTLKETPKYDMLRFAYNTLDQKGAFRAVIENDEVSGRNTRDLEDVVAASLSMLGFRTMAIDHLPGFNNATDILATDARGNLLSVECTVALPKPEEKIDLVYRKGALLRRAMDNAGLDDFQVISVLAVARPDVDLDPHRGLAAGKSVMLWGREALHKLHSPADNLSPEERYDAFACELQMLSISVTPGFLTDVS